MTSLSNEDAKTTCGHNLHAAGKLFAFPYTNHLIDGFGELRVDLVSLAKR